MALPSIPGHGIWWRRAAIALSLAVTVVPKWPWNYLGSSASRTPLSQLRAVSRQPFQTLTRPVFDGLEDLEEEEEEELEDRSTVPKERSMVSRPIGTGLQILEDLYSKHRGSKDPPEIDDEELEDLHAMLKEELPRCPSISSLAFAAKVLEDLELEEDDVFEVIATEVKARADELEPQETLDIVLSFGAIYFNDDELLAALVGAIRRQLPFFTNAEIVRLANAMSRLGGLDDSKHVGMFFEMRSRVNMPLIDKAIRDMVDTVAGMAVHELVIPLPGNRSLRLLEAADSNEATVAFRALGHQDPFGSKAWPSAYLVAERLLSEEVFGHPNESSASVLELGCGTGLVSLAALIGGATNVLATDQAKVNLDLAQRSARLNGLHLDVEVFDVTSEAPLPRCGSKAFDYVVFSDVLYWPAEAAAFASRAAEAYCQGSTVIMADPGRRRDDFIGALHRELEKRVMIPLGSAGLVAPEATKFPHHVFEWVSSEVKTASSLFCQEPFILTLRPNPPVFKVPAVFEIVD